MHEIKLTSKAYQKSPHLVSCLFPSKTITQLSFKHYTNSCSVLFFPTSSPKSKQSPAAPSIKISTLNFSDSNTQFMTRYSQLTQSSPIFLSKVLYYSQSKVATHLSIKLNPAIHKSEGLS